MLVMWLLELSSCSFLLVDTHDTHIVKQYTEQPRSPIYLFTPPAASTRLCLCRLHVLTELSHTKYTTKHSVTHLMPSIAQPSHRALQQHKYPCVSHITNNERRLTLPKGGIVGCNFPLLPPAP